MLYLAFAASVALLIASPGPVAMLVMHDARHGWPLLTIAGGVVAALLLMTLALLAVHLALDVEAMLLEWGQVVGGLYLLWLGWQSSASEPSRKHDSKSLDGGRFRRALAVGLSNPKDILFFLAFLPGFVRQDTPLLPQALLLMTIWALLDIAIMSAYGTFAHRWLRSSRWLALLPRYCLAAMGLASLLMGASALWTGAGVR